MRLDGIRILVLRNITEAIQFNNFHEGVHLGVVLGLLKLTR